jgi:hypothetical protein
MYETWEFFALGKGFSNWSLSGRAAQVRNTIEAMGEDGNQGIRDTKGCHYYLSIISIYQDRPFDQCSRIMRPGTVSIIQEHRSVAVLWGWDVALT